MKDPMGFIGYALLLVVISSFILQFASRDYLTTFTSETKPTEIPSSSSLQETATVRVVENPDGPKNVFVEASVNLKLSDSMTAQFFDSSKYENYVRAFEIRKEALDLLKNIWDQHSEGIALFVTLLSIPFALLAFIRKTHPF